MTFDTSRAFDRYRPAMLWNPDRRDRARSQAVPGKHPTLEVALEVSLPAGNSFAGVH
jgi:hypothetical protein